MKIFNKKIGLFTCLGLLCSATAMHAQGSGPSALDTSFSGDGLFAHKVGAVTDSSGATGVAIQSDGKSVSVGYANGNFALARYSTFGTLDASFGTGGEVITDMGGADFGRALALQSDGKIVAVGNKNGEFAIARYNSNGSLDGSFGNGGKTIFGLGGSDIAKAVAIQADGKIVVAGSTDTLAVMVRLNANGSMDGAFGQVALNYGGNNSFNGVAIQSDGSIVAAGTTNATQFQSLFIRRYDRNGNTDNSFGSRGGITFRDINPNVGTSSATGVIVQSDGRIVVCGNADGVFAAVRLGSNGSIDRGFGGADGYIGSTSGRFAVGNCTSIAIDPRGYYVLAGYSQTPGGDYDFKVARYRLSDGGADTYFNYINGRIDVDTDFFPGARLADGAFGVAVQRDGRIVAVGESKQRFAVARYYGSSTGAAANNRSSASGGSS